MTIEMQPHRRDLLLSLVAMRQGLLDASQLLETAVQEPAGAHDSLLERLMARGLVDSQAIALLETELHALFGERSTVPQGEVDGRQILATTVLAREQARPSGGGTEETEDYLGAFESDHRGAFLAAVSDLSLGARRDDPARPTGPRYRRERVLGRGGMGQVWSAIDTLLGRRVALKEVRPDLSPTPELVGRFFREARITGRLHHPAIPAVYDLIKEPNLATSYYTMPLFQERTLRDAIREFHAGYDPKKSLARAWHKILAPFIDVVNAVAYSHSEGVLHRDLKPSNVLIGSYGEVQVIDWGVAKFVGSPDAEGVPSAENDEGRTLESSETATGARVGTLVYMAPELIRGSVAAPSFETDIYSLGAILYEVLTNRRPYPGERSADVLRVIAETTPPLPRSINPGIPRPLEAICLRAMDRDTSKRYRTASDLAKDVQHWITDDPVAAYKEGIGERISRWVRHHRSAVHVSIAGVLATMAALAIGNYALDQERRRAEEARDAARADLQLASNVVDRMTVQIVSQHLPHIPRVTRFELALLEEAARHHASFYARDPSYSQAIRFAVVLNRKAHLSSLLNLDREASLQFVDAARVLRARSELARGDFEMNDRLAEVLLYAAEHEISFGRSAAAQRFLDEANQVSRQNLLRQPEALDAMRTAGLVAIVLSDQNRRQGKLDEARASAQFAVEQLEKALEQDPTADHRYLLPFAHGVNARIAAALGEKDSAAAAYRRAFEEAQELEDREPEDRIHRRVWAILVGDQLEAHADLPSVVPEPPGSDVSDALAWFDRDTLDSDQGLVPRLQAASLVLNRSRVAQQRGQAAEARALLDDAIARLETLQSAIPTALSVRGVLGVAYTERAAALAQEGQAIEASINWAIAMQHLEAALAGSPEDVKLQQALRTARGMKDQERSE